MKVKALITLVIGKNKEVLPGTVCDISDMEGNRLIARGFAEKLTKEATVNSVSSGKKQTENKENNDESDENGSEQPIQPAGAVGDIQK